MQIDTQYGPQDINPDSLIEFPQGLAGFEDLHQFKLFHEEGAQILYYLQSVEDPGVQLPLVLPNHFNVSYELTLSDEETELLRMKEDSDIFVMVTVARPDDPEGESGGFHANFLGPIVINPNERKGIQKALNNISGSVVIKAS